MDKLDMEYTDENVMAVAQEIVDDMDLDDLMTYVYDDLCAIMDKDEELFHINVEHFQYSDHGHWLHTKNEKRISILHRFTSAN